MTTLLQSERGTTPRFNMRLATIYRLSSTQAKKLLISNNELVIAFPTPIELPDDFPADRVVGLAMPEHYQFCERAEYQVLPVLIPGRLEGESPTKGTQGVLGRILSQDEAGKPQPRPLIFVECIVGRFVPPSRRIIPAPDGLIAWAGKVFHDGAEVEPAGLYPPLASAAAPAD